MTPKTAVSALFLSSVLGLSSCGVIYTSPSVSSQAQGLDVRVLPVTAESVLFANRIPYNPRGLPGAFYQTAGATGDIRGLGALPEPPVIPEQVPRQLELRLPPAVNPAPYTIGVGDGLRVATRGASDPADVLAGATIENGIRQEYIVRDDGAIAIPEVGPVQVAGLTLERAEAAIFERLIETGIDPTFSLEISTFNSQRASVGGDVGSPTLVPITLNTLDLGEAITAAGGLTVREAEYASIRIYRDGSLYQIPLVDFFATADYQNIPVLAGDAIFVDTSYDLDRAIEYYESQIDIIALRRNDRAAALNELTTEINIQRDALDEQRDNFLSRQELGAEERDYIYLAGEFTNQSRWPLPYAQVASLADVIYENGGFPTATGDASQIYVLRASADPREFGAVTAWHLNASNAVAITLATRFEMRPNDIVFVEEQVITSWNRALNQLLPSLFNSVAGSVQ
jgi:polysaccharide export outer membrane protein